jgi:hypothetical protein
MVSPRVLNGIYYHEEHYKYLTKLWCPKAGLTALFRTLTR